VKSDGSVVVLHFRIGRTIGFQAAPSNAVAAEAECSKEHVLLEIEMHHLLHFVSLSLVLLMT